MISAALQLLLAACVHVAELPCDQVRVAAADAAGVGLVDSWTAPKAFSVEVETAEKAEETASKKPRRRKLGIVGMLFLDSAGGPGVFAPRSREAPGDLWSLSANPWRGPPGG